MRVFHITARLRARWVGYWLAPGGRISVAVLRIAVAVSLLWMLWRIAHEPGAPSRLYHRHGIWMLYPGRPSAVVVSAVTGIAWLSTVAMLLGWRTRIAQATSAITAMAVAAYAASASAAWSHGDVPPVLASLALLGARCGDALSIDAGLARRAPAGAGYQGAVRLVQLAVAAVFVLAGLEKLRSGGLALAWALSDNLRHQLLTRFDWSGAQRTAVASWLLAASWRYQLCASGNLISQLAPALAVIFVRRPRLRALAGAAWCAEIIGLGLVMGFWNLHWLPLGAAFIDWDALAARLGMACAVDAPRRSRGPVVYATAFAVFFAIQALWLNQRLHAYPFSRFALFATVRAKRPYGVHQTYELPGGHLEVLGWAGAPGGEHPRAAEIEAWMAGRAAYRWLWRERDPARLEPVLAHVLGDVRDAWPRTTLTGVRLWLSIFQAPAYPAPPRLERFDAAVLGELERGVFRSALGTLLGDRRTWLAPPGAPALAGMQLFALRDDVPDLVPIAATATPSGFVLAAPLAGDPVYLIGRVPGAPHAWLLAFRCRRRY